MPRIIYLHGFASGPGSSKAQYFRERFARREIRLEVPDLAEGDFTHLTITRQLGVIQRLAAGDAVSLVGSSLGGYLAALYAARHAEVERLVLMAPAFRFAKRWTETMDPKKMEEWRSTGHLAVYHYSEGREVEVGYELWADAVQYEDYPRFEQPALIFHGIRDTVVPVSDSIELVRHSPSVELRRVDSGHELLDVLEEMGDATEAFLLK